MADDDIDDPLLRWLWAYLAVACAMLGGVTTFVLGWAWWLSVLLAVGLFGAVSLGVWLGEQYYDRKHY